MISTGTSNATHIRPVYPDDFRLNHPVLRQIAALPAYRRWWEHDDRAQSGVTMLRIQVKVTL
jgi:hypothetical protein